MAKQKVVNDGVNQNILNIITPPGMEFKKNSFILGENYGKALVVTKYPPNPEYGWISSITQLPGVTALTSFNPTDSGPLIDRSNEQIKAYRGDLTVTKEESIRQSKEAAIEDIQEMIRKVNRNGEMVGYCTIVYIVQAQTERLLDERIKKVHKILLPGLL